MRYARHEPCTQRAGRRGPSLAVSLAMAAVVGCATDAPPLSPAYRVAAPLPAAGQPQRPLPPIPADSPAGRAGDGRVVRTDQPPRSSTSPRSHGVPTGFGRPPWGARSRRGTGTGFIWGRRRARDHQCPRGRRRGLRRGRHGRPDDVRTPSGSGCRCLTIFCAVLRIDAPSAALQPVDIGDSAALRVGQSVYAIGNPFGLSATLTTGIVSALGRRIQGLDGTPIEDVGPDRRRHQYGQFRRTAPRQCGSPDRRQHPDRQSLGRIGRGRLRRARQYGEPGRAADHRTPANTFHPALGIRMDGRGYLSRFVLGRLRAAGVLVVGVERGSGAAEAGLRGYRGVSRRTAGQPRSATSFRLSTGSRSGRRGELRAVLDRVPARRRRRQTVTILRDGDTLDVVVTLS